MYDRAKDWFSRPSWAFLWWWLPLLLGAFASLEALAKTTTGLVWTTLFLWMGTGCALNAWRCHRLHCYVSAPVFLLGALSSALTATGILGVRVNNVVGATLVLALLSFVPEMVRRPKPPPGS